MPRSVGEGWQELQTPSRRQCPKLFYHFSTTEKSFTILLTDLICIWESSLDNYDIVAAASRQRTSIDPSATGQLQVLLSKLRKSLQNGENTIMRGTVRDVKTLLLRTEIALPRPLKALAWTFTLVPQATSELAEHILRPSLHEVDISQKKIASLLSAINEKDHVISRLLDRNGTSAVDLSLVFPSIPKKGGHVSVADAKRHVVGMAEFDQKGWMKQYADEEGYEGADRTGLSNLVRGCEKCFVHSDAEHEDWTQDLPSSDKIAEDWVDESRKPAEGTSTERKAGSDDHSTDDEFERQATPPHLKSKHHTTTMPTATATNDNNGDEHVEARPFERANPSKIGASAKRDASEGLSSSNSPPRNAAPAPAERAPLPRRRDSRASTTTETASEEEEPKPPPARQSKAYSSIQKSKLSAPTKKKASTRSPSATPTPSPPPCPMPMRSRPSCTSSIPKEQGNRDPDETETESEDKNLDASPPPPTKAKTKPNPPSAQKSPAKPRLGRLGTRKDRRTLKSTIPEAAVDDNKAAEPEPETPVQTPSRKRIGRLGGLRKKNGDGITSPVPSPSKPPSSKPKPHRSTQGNLDDSDATDSPSPSLPRTSQHTSPAAHRPPQEVQAKSSPPRKTEETAEEAAARRRMELKRTIAASDKGKKKRRF